MNRALQWKLIAGFILVFIAGGMTGAFFAVSHSRRMFIESHEPGVMFKRMRERLRVELKLTAGTGCMGHTRRRRKGQSRN